MLKCCCVFLSLSQCKFISQDFNLFMTILLWTNTVVVVLYVEIDVGSWGCPIAIKIWRIGSESFVFWKTLFVSASVTDVTTSLRVLYSIRITILSFYLNGLVLVVPSLKYPVILLRALGNTRYAASESTKSCMLIA